MMFGSEDTCDSVVLQDHLDVILHIMSFLPSTHKAAVAKLVCKAAHSAFKEYNHISIASCGDLPSVCVLDALKQLQQSEQEGVQPRLMAAVALQGYLPWLQLLHDHGCEWSSPVCAAAAEGGHLDILQWLRAQDPPCECENKVVGSLAAAYGHVDVLEWALAQHPPAPWDAISDYACLAAAFIGHLHILQWVEAQQPALPWNKAGCLEIARKRGKAAAAIVEWLESIGVQ